MSLETASRPAASKLHRILDLDRGGMGRVWLAALHGGIGLTKLLVVKELHPQYARDPHCRAMFLEEARLAAKLNHPNVVQTLEARERNGALFLIMEYLEGQSLHAVRARRRLPLEFEVAILSNVCAGLHHAHEAADFDGTPLGLVHRDVCPQNVIISYSGQIKVVDFGIARATASTGESVSGAPKGRIRYMAPEQARVEDCDRRADLFSVGILLWEALAGKSPWDGLADTELWLHLTRGTAPSVSTAVPGAPAELVRICGKALAPEREARYGSALEIQTELEMYLSACRTQVTPREIASLVGTAFEPERQRTRAVIREKFKALWLDAGSRTSGQPPASAASASRVSPRSFLVAPPSKRDDNVSNSGAYPEARHRSPLHPPPKPSSTLPKPPHFPQRTSPPLPTSVSSSDDGHAAVGSAPADLALPPPYSIQRELAPGTASGARLFEGRLRTTGQAVVVQILDREQDLDSIARKLRPGAAFRHPNAVALLDVGMVATSGAAVYVVREFVEGESLATLLARVRQLPLADALEIASQLLVVLADAHAAGLVHPRLTPDHVLIARTECDGALVKVLGFWPSLARSTRAGSPYASPEEASLVQPTARSNVYSAGALLYHCCFGSPPPLASPTRRLSIPAASTPNAFGLDALLTRALQLDPASRFPTATDMLDAMALIDTGEAPALHGSSGPLQRHGFARDAARCAALPVVREPAGGKARAIWVLDDDPALAHETTRAALAELARDFEVRVLGQADRELALSELRSARLPPPCVVVFGNMHVLLEDPLLLALSPCAEASRMLIATHENLELLEASINWAGLDYYLTLPAEASSIVAGITQLARRTHVVSEHYDGIRRALRQARDQLGELSRALTERTGSSYSLPPAPFGFGIDLESP